MSCTCSLLRYEANAARYVLQKTQKLATRLSKYSFMAKHITRESSISAGMLTRWAAAEKTDLLQGALEHFEFH